MSTAAAKTTKAKSAPKAAAKAAPKAAKAKAVPKSKAAAAAADAAAKAKAIELAAGLDFDSDGDADVELNKLDTATEVDGDVSGVVDGDVSGVDNGVDNANDITKVNAVVEKKAGKKNLPAADAIAAVEHATIAPVAASVISPVVSTITPATVETASATTEVAVENTTIEYAGSLLAANPTVVTATGEPAPSAGDELIAYLDTLNGKQIEVFANTNAGHDKLCMQIAGYLVEKLDGQSEEFIKNYFANENDAPVVVPECVSPQVKSMTAVIAAAPAKPKRKVAAKNK